MGVLRAIDDAQRVEVLPPRCLIGRSRVCDLHLGARDISSQHAVVQWLGAHWELQDLASRNGTFLNDRRLAPGERAPLRRGDRLRIARQFGDWELLDDAAPTAMARSLIDGRVCIARRGLLALPDAERPEVTIHTGSTDGWLLERDGETREIHDRALVQIGADQWRIYLPSPGAQTFDESGRGLRIADLHLRFAHSIDEEYIELVATAGAQRIDLKARAHHYPLLLLARARAADLAQGVAPPDQGWLLLERLLEMLRIEVSHLNISIHRSRIQLGHAGIADAVRLIERRQGTRQLRIGVSQLEIAPL